MFFFFDENESKSGVPGFEKTMKPILRALQENNGSATIEQLDKAVIQIMNLPEEVANIKHKDSGKQKEIEYRIAWGRTYLKKYGLITNVSRGKWTFTNKFDGDLEKIDVDEIVRKVRNDSAGDNEEKLPLSGFESAIAFENMVIALLRDITGKENKRIYLTYSDSVDFGYDMILPNGVEECDEEIKCIIEYVKTPKQNEANFHAKIKNKLNKIMAEGRLLLITNVVVSKRLRDAFGTNVMIWDNRDLAERIEPEASYAQYIINPRQALIEEVVVADNSIEQKKAERDRYIKQAKSSFRKQDMVLFLGAGVSIDGGIPLWETLIKTLHVYMLKKLTSDKNLSFEQQEMIEGLASNNEMESPLIQMRYIKSAFINEEYYQLVHSALYGQDVDIDTKLLDAIAKISTPQRGYCGIKSIITYNFDDLVERKFTQKDIQYNIVSDEKERHLIEKLNVYHVHGYLPSNIAEIPDEPNLVFSEEDYHRVYRDAYSWSNLTQLNALRENTCLFIGCSLNDPNLRRLLDVAARDGETPRHYAFLKKKRIKSEAVNKDILELYQKIDDNIQTAYYKTLGLNIIWVDEFEEIPNILNGFVD